MKNYYESIKEIGFNQKSINIIIIQEATNTAAFTCTSDTLQWQEFFCLCKKERTLGGPRKVTVCANLIELSFVQDRIQGMAADLDLCSPVYGAAKGKQLHITK